MSRGPSLASVEDPLQDSGGEERAAEGEAGAHLRALQRALRGRRALAAEVVLAGGGGRRGGGVVLGPEAGRGDVAAGQAAGPGRRGRPLLGATARLGRLGL